MRHKAMSELAASSTAEQTSDVPSGTTSATALQIFLEFLLIGATSFGGGIVAYLRNSLVTKRAWVSDKAFVELLAISQSLPGLNSSNMAILVGDRLCGVRGALAAITGICLPSGLLMFAVGMVYHQHGDHPLVTAALKGVAASAVYGGFPRDEDPHRGCVPLADVPAVGSSL
jgi:chromate transporter